MFTKNSLTVQESVIFFFLVWCCSCSKSIIIFLRGTVGAVKIRLVLIDWRWEAACQLSLLLHAVTLHCDLQLFLHLISLERCQSRCQSRCWSILILTTWLTTWLMTCPHQELEAASLHFCRSVYRPIISVRLNVGFPRGICQDVTRMLLVKHIYSNG